VVVVAKETRRGRLRLSLLFCDKLVVEVVVLVVVVVVVAAVAEDVDGFVDRTDLDMLVAEVGR